MWMDGPLPDELAGFPGYLMSRLGQGSARRFAMALEPLGIHPKHFGVMSIVAAQPGITQNALRERTGIDPSSMVAVIDELQALGLAERRPHPLDRRARTIYLTAAGEKALERGRQLGAELQREYFAPLTAEEQRTLHALLQKLAWGHVKADPRPSAPDHAGADLPPAERAQTGADLPPAARGRSSA
ncbi:MAG TPA: MarR family winged helix-turn-helix transcriptional regulator [Solirubrobacteraceae bacterium]|nr:MarR family winged helix-turn-helix transcriptional regulator [Solirubrobacteraceae bacterium]